MIIFLGMLPTAAVKTWLEIRRWKRFFSENAKATKDVENVCLYNKDGYCKFRNLCKFNHVEEIGFDVERCAPTTENSSIVILVISFLFT